MTALKHVTIHTDGGALGNPGPGGYGVILSYKQYHQELSGGFRYTTNNRMEILAAIVGLRALKTRCAVILYSDSQYLVNAMTQGWAKRWQANGWMRNKKEQALNSDLWEELLQLCEQHTVTFRWIKGHAGDPNNERCDWLVKEAARRENLPPDTNYERDHL